MADSPASQGRPVKEIKLAGRNSYGKIPKVFLDGENNIMKMEFDIHDFPNLQQKRNEYFYTGTIKAHGHLWKLRIYPQGDIISNAVVDHVSIYLVYAGENAETNPAKGVVRTKTVNKELPKHEFSIRSCGWTDFGKREDIIKNDCNEAGTLTITVELQVATEMRSVWYPQLTSCDYTQLYNCTETSDITFIIGTSKKEFIGHKCIFFHRARVLYELVRTEEESFSSSSSSGNNNNFNVVLTDVDEKAFEVLLQFVYSSEEPKLNHLDEEAVKSILLVANRLGVTELKLYAESVLVEKFLVPLKAAAFLVFADSYTCPLLKQESMNAYITDSTTVMNSVDDWNTLQESPKLLTELLVYATSDRKRYSSIVVTDGDDGTLENTDELDVTSLRERLQQINLDVDGSREILLERWKEYLLATNNNNNSVTTASFFYYFCFCFYLRLRLRLRLLLPLLLLLLLPLLLLWYRSHVGTSSNGVLTYLDYHPHPDHIFGDVFFRSHFTT